MITQFCKGTLVASINFLNKKKECICGNIVNELPLSQSDVSQQLKKLKNAGMIKE